MTAQTGGLLVTVAVAAAFSSSPTVSAQSGPTDKPAPPLVIRVGVDLVQLDAVVTDQEGRPVRDLRAEDFTLEVDGKVQPVLNAMFFEGRTGAGTSTAPAAAPSPDQTMVLIVDDLNASFGSIHKTRRAVKEFARGWGFREARIGLRATSDEGSTYILTHSPERFDEAAKKVRYNMRSNKGPSSSSSWLLQNPESGATPLSARWTSEASVPWISGNPLPPTTSATAAFQGGATQNAAIGRANYEQRAYSLLTTINSLRSLPGRKAVVLVSEGFALGRDRDLLGIESPFNTVFAAEPFGVDAVLRMITEVANRASVAIYTVDPSSLQPASARSAAGSGAWFDRAEAQGTLKRLSEDTGGFSVDNHNDLAGGLRDVASDQRAYYLIGFEPPASTFVKNSGRPDFHEISIKVNRPGLRVRTRAGFYGVTDEEVLERAPLVSSPED